MSSESSHTHVAHSTTQDGKYKGGGGYEPLGGHRIVDDVIAQPLAEGIQISKTTVECMTSM